VHVQYYSIYVPLTHKSEGYRDVGLRWNPFWAGRSAEIGYYVKNLDSDEADHSRKKKQSKGDLQAKQAMFVKSDEKD
jgi:hypothetical protein